MGNTVLAVKRIACELFPFCINDREDLSALPQNDVRLGTEYIPGRQMLTGKRT
ncbi:hypothetical protein [Sphingopyxis macrogoltabida]|uniref:hypothetical protein n=1 Tax=Sphingopyxis macrogoltabida TaxID=33050 RepID=UPI001F27B756|nr:hypothetical protein [Sphingopyxis macrogoltabida]